MSHVTPQNPQSSTTGGLPVKLNASTNDTTVSANSTNTFFLIGSGGISVSGDGPTNSIVFSGSGASFTNNVASGATGRTTLTSHGVMLGEGSNNVNVTAAGSSGQVLIGSTGADPMFSLITSSAGTLSFVVGAGQLNIEVATSGGISGIVGVASGGTGRTILTSHGVVLGEGASIVNVTAAGSSGQVLIGSTGLDPAFALITSSAGTLSFVLGPNLLNIEVASSGGITGIVGVASGGTGRTVFTSHGVLIGEGSNEVNATLAGTNGQVLIGSNGLDPVFALITSSANTLSFTLGAGLLNIEVASAGISGVVGVVNGGTGRTVLTSHGVLLGEGSNNINVVPVGTNGQVLIGATNADPAFATFSSMSNTLTFVFNPSNLSIDINSPVSITYGGTNATSFGPTTSSVLYYNGNGIGNLNAGSAGQVLVSQGYGIAPSFLFIGTPSQINISDNTGASVSSSVFSILGNTAAGFPIYTAFTGTKLFINITSIPVTLGGTGQTILTNHGILIGAGTNNVTVATQGTDGQLLIGSTTGDPAFATLSSISNTLTFVVGHNSLSVDLVAPVRVPFGGTGRTVLTTSGVLLGEGSNNVNVTAAGTDGQVLIGSSTGDPAFATISSITGTMTFVINHNNLSIDIKAPVPLAYGGTNNTNYGATASVVYFDGTKLNAVSIGTVGQVLSSQGPGLPPIFQTSVASGTVSTIDLEGTVTDTSRSAILKVGTNFSLGATTTSAQYDIFATSTFQANPGTTYNNVYGASLTPIVVAVGTGSVGNIFGSYVNLTSTAGSGTPTSNAYGLFVDQATLANTTTAYGLYVLSPIGAGTNISGYFSTAPVFGTPLLVVSGGTGRTVLTTSGVLLGEGSNNINVTAAGTDGQVLIGSSTGDPAFATISSITGTMTFVINHNNLSIDVKAPLPLAYGGTNNTSYGATASVVYYDGTKLNAVSIGTSGQLLVSQGPGLPPVFQSAVASGTVSTIDLEGSVIDNSRPAILKVGTNFVLGATTTSAQYDIWATSVFAANPGTTYNNVYGASITPTITATGSGSVGNIYGTYINYSSTAATGSATGNAYGLFVDAISVQNTTSAYGLYVRTPTGASVSNITAVLGVLPTAQVGIGTGAPGSMLGVAGTVAIGSYAGTAAPANSLIVSGQVGIGTVSPSQTLDVAGSIRASGLTQANQLINIFQGYDQGGFGSGYVGTQKTISGNNSAYFDTATFVNSNSIAFAGAVSDGRFIYFVPNGSTTSTGQITRYDTASSFSSSNSFAVFDLTANVNSLANGFFGAVSTGRIIYFIPGTNFSGTRSGLVVRFDTALSFTAASSYSTFDMTVNVNSNSNGFFGGIYDGRYVYYAPSGNASGTQSGQITRFDPTGSFTSASSYSVFDTATVQSLSNGFQSAVFDGRYVYFVPSVNVLATRSGQVTRYDTSLTFTSASSYATFDMATVSTFAVGFEAGAFDGRFVYFAPNFNLAATSSGAIARYDTTLSFTSSASYSVFDTTVNVNSNSNGFIGAIFDNRYVYFLPNANASGTRSGQITRFDTTLAFTSASSYSIFNLTTSSNSLSNGFVGGVFDGRHIYLAPGTNVLGRSGQIARLDGYPGSQATALAANAAPNGFIMPTISYASVLYSGGATTTIAGAAPGASGTVLTSNGVGVAPSFQPAAGGASTQTINNISSSGTFSVSTSYSYYSVDSGSGGITLKFPNTTTGGQSWVIKDRTGNTALNNIIITTVSGTVTFDGETTFNLINPFGSVNIVYNSTSAAYEIY